VTARRYPALAQWRRELRNGRRTPYSYDPLWRAASAEMNAFEAEQDGVSAERYRADAHVVLEQAIRTAS
jgi:hypothetical protein